MLYGQIVLLCYTDSFIICVKTEDIYKDIVEDVETRFNTETYEIDRPYALAKK